jgi:predicted dehydrogenase
VIATPDHWHCLMAVEACAAGKDAYVEKPLGNSIAEARAIVAAKNRHGRVLQVGQWQRSHAHVQSALDFLASGKLGRVRVVRAWAYQGWVKALPAQPDATPPEGVDYALWLGPAARRPFNLNRFHFNFRWFWDYGGGLQTDWGVHLLDFALQGTGAREPLSVTASGGKLAFPEDPTETPDTLTTVFDFGDFVMQWEHACGINNGHYGRDHGVAFVGNNGTLILDRGGWRVLTEGDRMEKVVEVAASDNGKVRHARNFIDAVKTRGAIALRAPAEAGAAVAELCQMGNIAYRTGKKLLWDRAKRQFTDAEANRLITPQYHNGFSLPAV